MRFLFEGGASVTRCQNKNSPIFFKICPKSSKRKFYSKVPFSKKPKSCKMGTLWEPLLPRPSKSSPIRSHWVALTICLLHSREIVGSSRRGGGGMSRKNDNFLINFWWNCIFKINFQSIGKQHLPFRSSLILKIGHCKIGKCICKLTCKIQ